MNSFTMNLGLKRRALSSLLLGFAMILSMGTLWAQGEERQLERATESVQELMGFRLQAALKAAQDRKEWSPDKVAELDELGGKAIGEFLDKHPVKRRPRGRVSFGPEPFIHEGFATFLESDMLAKALQPDDLKALTFEHITRQERVTAALADLIQLLVKRGLCLSEPDAQALREVCREAAEKQLDEGWKAPYRMYHLSGEVPKTFARLLKRSGLHKILEGERLAIFKEIAQEGRTPLHDHFLEVEFLLAEMEDATKARKLLRGCADSLIHQNGAKPQVDNNRLGPVSRLEKNDFWNLMLKHVLGLAKDQDLPELPSRSSESMVGLRSEYLLAILDSQAYLSASQLEELEPLILQFVKREGTHWRSGTLDALLLPNALAMNADGILDSTVKQGRGSGARVKALRTGLAEACTPQQKELLDV